MKKYVAILILMLSVSVQAQKLSSQFNVKKYAIDQTEMIKSALNLDQQTADLVFNANMKKAYSIHKYILLKESQNEAEGKTLQQIIKEVQNDAERGAGYQHEMKSILGDKYDEFVDKFGNND